MKKGAMKKGACFLTEKVSDASAVDPRDGVGLTQAQGPELLGLSDALCLTLAFVHCKVQRYFVVSVE